MQKRNLPKSLIILFFALMIYNTSNAVDSNLALNKPVTVTDDWGTSYGEKLVDGLTDDGNKWVADAGFPQSAEVDLEEDCNLSEIRLYTYDSRAYQYIIEASTDGTNYTTIVDRSSNTDGTQPITDAVNVTARYVKLTVTGASGYTGSYASINEMEVYGSVAPSVVSVTSVSVSPASVTLDVNQTSDLTETVLPANATDKTVNWSTSDGDVATVDASGVVSALSGGQAIITVTTTDGGFTDECEVTVNCPVINVPSNFSATKGDQQITLSWDVVIGADEYTIKYGTAPGGPYASTINITDGATDNKVVSGLTNGTTYYFIISATKGICESDESGEVSAEPSSFIDEYLIPNVVYISTVNSGKNLGAGISANKINGTPEGFNGNLTPVNFVIDISAPLVDDNLDACLTIFYSDDDIPEGLNYATFDLFRFDDNSNKWVKMEGTLNPENKSITLCGINEFSTWTLAGSVPQSVPLGNWGIIILSLLIAMSIFGVYKF